MEYKIFLSLTWCENKYNLKYFQSLFILYCLTYIHSVLRKAELPPIFLLRTDKQMYGAPHPGTGKYANTWAGIEGSKQS